MEQSSSLLTPTSAGSYVRDSWQRPRSTGERAAKQAIKLGFDAFGPSSVAFSLAATDNE
jgi:hypothetical protein